MTPQDVADMLGAVIREAVARERTRCAKIVEQWPGAEMSRAVVAAAIRGEI
jgi:hypothetical protein